MTRETYRQWADQLEPGAQADGVTGDEIDKLLRMLRQGSFGSHFMLARTKPATPPGLARFQREVNYNGRLQHAGIHKLREAWELIEGEANTDTIIDNIKAHLAAGTWPDKMYVSTILESGAWMHPPEGDEPESGDFMDMLDQQIAEGQS